MPNSDPGYRFNDPYTAMNIIQLGYIGNRSIVFHDANGTRIACATLVKVAKEEVEGESEVEEESD